MSQAQDHLSTSALAAIAGVDAPAAESIGHNANAPEALNLLISKAFYMDAVRLLAHLMPKREAVWWAWVSVRRSPGAHPSPEETASLQATEKWLSQPTDENRRGALAAAEKARVGSAAGCAGLAAFLSGDSLAPVGAQPVPPGEYLSAKAVANAIILAASSAPEQTPETLRGFLGEGMKLTERIGLWRKQEKN
jgi:hypothetical protein